jgi:uncharacterized membrane protein
MEVGPWGGVVLLVLLIGLVLAVQLTSFLLSGVALFVVVILPIAAIVYFAGRRIARRFVHGSR